MNQPKMRITPLRLFIFLMIPISILLIYYMSSTSTPKYSPPTYVPPTPTQDTDKLIATASPTCAKAFTKSVLAGSVSGPVLVILNKTYESKDWNQPYISVPNMEINLLTPINISALVCIKETRDYKGMYTNGQNAYRLNWDVRLIRWPDGVVVAQTQLIGEEPPHTIIDSKGDVYGFTPNTSFYYWLVSELGN